MLGYSPWNCKELDKPEHSQKGMLRLRLYISHAQISNIRWIIKKASEVAHSCPTLCNPIDCSLPGSSSMGFSRREYWSGLPLPSPGHIYTCGQFMLMYGKNHHNIVNYPPIKINKIMFTSSQKGLFYFQFLLIDTCTIFSKNL